MKTIVIIEWDKPEQEQWLCPENIELALSSYCKNTKFKVTKFELELPDDKNIQAYVKSRVRYYGGNISQEKIANECAKWLRDNIKEQLKLK